jgi:glutaminyl-tRNA synthetase
MATDISSEAPAPEAPKDFIRDIVAADLTAGRHTAIRTRFPPEPNGYLHIGHAKSICLNFGIAREFGGTCNLRMDDTNPTKEDVEYVESIQRDVHWLIDGWADHVLSLKPAGESSGKGLFAKDAGGAKVEPYFASDYFEQLYGFGVELINRGLAFVCDLTAEQVAQHRGTPTIPGAPSPHRDRSVSENLDLFARMRKGEFPDGAKTLRAKIDMASPNIHLRDPALYRIRHAHHHRTGGAWCLYPMYDFAHCLSDALEGITHSICTLEFEVHRPLYDWIIENVTLPRPLPHQYEFARLSLTYTVMSKRKLLELVEKNLVSDWDDPRMPTISGMRRRGYTARSLRNFAYHVGVTKYKSLTDVAVLEHAVREDLNQIAQRRLAVLRPIKVVITNYPEGQVEQLDAINNPEDESAGRRQLPFTRELFIDQDDFAEVPPPKFFRLKPGGEVRLKYAYIIKCEEVVKDVAGRIVELRCTADLDSKSGGPTAGRKIKGTIHWVSAAHAVEAEVRLYDRLFTVEEPDAVEGKDFTDLLNPNSLETLTGCKLESSLQGAQPVTRFQFERLGYFCIDSADQQTPADAGRLVFNRIITLRDSWARAGK